MKCDEESCTLQARTICHFDGEKNYYYCHIHEHDMELIAIIRNEPLRKEVMGLFIDHATNV